MEVIRMSKRKRVVLTFQEKLDILQQLNDGKSGAHLARQYGIGTSTISDIKRNGEAILQFVANLHCEDQISAKRTRKTAQNTDLDSRIFKWYNEEKNKGVPLPDAAVCAKALELNKELNGNENFKASLGWLRHFKNRHGIREVKEQCEESADIGTGRRLRNVLKRGGFTLENVYNADEGFWQWNSLPGCDNKGGNVVVIGCANANASHKLPICVFGQDEATSESVIYKQQSETFFEEWFREVFLPHVNDRQNSTGHISKVLLVIDDASWHHQLELLVKDHPNVSVFVIPNNITPTIQPIELELKRLKTLYKRQLLKLLGAKSPCPIKQFLEEFTITESIRAIGEAWDSIPRARIAESWGTILSNVKNDAKSNSPEISDIVATTRLEHCGSEEITRWLECDTDHPSEELPETESGPSDMDAYQCCDTVIRWLIGQEECNHEQLLVLESLRDLAWSKAYGNVKQEADESGDS